MDLLLTVLQSHLELIEQNIFEFLTGNCALELCTGQIIKGNSSHLEVIQDKNLASESLEEILGCFLVPKALFHCFIFLSIDFTTSLLSNIHPCKGIVMLLPCIGVLFVECTNITGSVLGVPLLKHIQTRPSDNSPQFMIEEYNLNANKACLIPSQTLTDQEKGMFCKKKKDSEISTVELSLEAVMIPIKN
jgi:hypothetical protein